MKESPVTCPSSSRWQIGERVLCQEGADSRSHFLYAMNLLQITEVGDSESQSDVLELKVEDTWEDCGSNIHISIITDGQPIPGSQLTEHAASVHR